MLLLIVALLLEIMASAQPAPFSFDRTMRVDYFHTGGPVTGETLALDRVVNDGAWPGSRTQLIDATNLGTYQVEVRAKNGGTLIYSRGYASVYGEWSTTAEATQAQRTFHESVRFPWPSGPVLIAIKKRQAENRFGTIWTTEIDPSSRFVNQAPP